MTDRLTIPYPVVMPFGSKLDKPEYVHEAWEVFHNNETPPSVEERLLTAMMRAVHEGLVQSTGECTECQKENNGTDNS